MPQLELCVNGHKLNFMVDSGAGYSVVRISDLPTSPDMSGHFIFSQGASGATVKENFTKPLKCAAQFEKHPIRFEHDFLWSPCSPINLLGRDLMIVLGLNLLSSPDGVTKLLLIILYRGYYITLKMFILLSFLLLLTIAFWRLIEHLR